jgi:Zn-dependent protease/predicted transcriptional regulator
MRWSWRVGKLAGIDLYVHWTFLLLVVWFLVRPLMMGQDAAEVVTNFVFILAVFACVVLHELGHALMARKYGIATRDITLLPIGGVARLEKMPDDPKQELWVALAGPAVNVVIAAALFAGVSILGRLDNIADIDFSLMGALEFFHGLMVVNLWLVAFNLLPAFPMDGGRVLRALLAQRMDYVRATHIASSVGQAMAILFGIGGFLSGNPFLMFIALFVYVGAGQEAAMTESRIAMQGIPVRAAMMTRIHVLSPSDPLEVAAKELVAGDQQDFPVAEEGRVVGMLQREDLFHAMRERQDHQHVSTIMRRDCPVVDENQMLEAVLARMQSNECPSLPVVRAGKIVGMITLENVGELLMLRRTQKAATHIVDGRSQLRQ